MQDFIEIKQLKTPAYIGVYEWEKKIKQKLLIDIKLYLADGNVQKAAKMDRLKDALDYTAVVNCVQHHVAEHSVQLIETLIESLAKKLLSQFNVSAVQLSIQKPTALAQAESVGVTIIRKKH